MRASSAAHGGHAPSRVGEHWPVPQAPHSHSCYPETAGRASTGRPSGWAGAGRGEAVAADGAPRARRGLLPSCPPARYVARAEAAGEAWRADGGEDGRCAVGRQAPRSLPGLGSGVAGEGSSGASWSSWDFPPPPLRDPFARVCRHGERTVAGKLPRRGVPWPVGVSAGCGRAGVSSLAGRLQC